MTKKEHKIQVIHSNGDKEDFKPRIIGNTIKRETNINDDLANKIQRRVANQLYKLGVDEISTGMIRSQVSSQLLKEGEIQDAETSKKMGMSVSEFEDLLTNGCKDNANIGYSAEMVAKYAYDSIAKEYALRTMPQDCAKAHREGYYRIHDLEYYNVRPNCFVADIRFFAKNGLNIDGKGLMGSVAGPAKSLGVLLRHLGEAWMAGAQCLSGGQAYAFWNVFLAPYAKGMSYAEIKQEVQAFIFDCNQSLVSRGGQVLFTSINVEFTIPEFLKNESAIGPGGIPIGTYSDYEREADLILRALIEVLSDGDANGRPHRFPNTIFMIRDDSLDNYEGNVKAAHELVAKFPTVYFGNCTSATGNINRTYMGCRTQSRSDWTGDWEYDTLNFGNFMYNTLNLPLMAKESDGDWATFKETVEYYCDLTKKSLLHRKECIEDILYNKHMSDFLLQKDKETGELLYQLDKNSFSIGFCGLNEAILELTNGKEDIISYPEFGEQIVKIIYNKCQQFKQETKLRFSTFSSPAESAANAFAEINKNKYPDAYVQGKKDHYYLTNSTHIPVNNSDCALTEHIENADIFHDYSPAGAILHLWLGETHPNPLSLWAINKKISQTNTSFWAFSTVFTACNDCGFTINDNIDKCPICGSTDVTKYDRCTGYYLPINGYNNGKTQEFNDRYRHTIV